MPARRLIIWLAVDIISHSLERRIHLLGHDFISFWILLSFSWSCFCELLMKNYNSKKEDLEEEAFGRCLDHKIET